LFGIWMHSNNQSIDQYKSYMDSTKHDETYTWNGNREWKHGGSATQKQLNACIRHGNPGAAPARNLCARRS
jgi:hypothetical protein